MSDPAPDPSPYRSAADRARTRSPWLLRYKFPQLRLRAPKTTERTLTREEVTWSVRGEPRTREHFSDPHPDDFPGGLPLPSDYLRLPA